MTCGWCWRFLTGERLKIFGVFKLPLLREREEANVDQNL